MELNKEAIEKALSSVLDPEKSKDIVSLGMVKEVVIGDHKIQLTLATSNPTMQHKKRMEDACLFAIERAFGNEVSAEITFIASTAKQDKGIPGVKHIIAVASGKGGVGKSTVTSNLAIGLSKKGYKVAVVDADVYGPSIPIMFNITDERPAAVQGDGSNKMMPVEAYGIQVMSLGFFAEPDQPIVWRGAMVSKALKQMFFDTQWKDVDYMLVDLPPGTGDIHLSLVQSMPVSGAIMVTTPQDVAIADVRKGAAMFKMPNVNVPVLGVVENMSWFTPKELPDNKYYIFGQNGGKNLAERLNLPLVGQVPLIQSVREAGDAGRPAIMQENSEISTIFDGIVDKLIDLHDKRLAELPETEVVQMTK